MKTAGHLALFMSALLIACSALQGSSVSCTAVSPSGTTSITNPSNCAFNLIPFTISAGVSDNVSSGVATLSLGTAVGIGPPQNEMPGYQALAHADDTIAYGTGEPSRSGFLQLSASFVPQADLNNFAAAVITDGVHDYRFSGLGTGNPPPVTCPPVNCIYSATVPFDLGTDFEVAVSSDTNLSSAGFSQPEFVSIRSTISFSLLEADGTTAVPLFVVPEPVTWKILGLGFVAGVCFRVGRKRRFLFE